MALNPNNGSFYPANGNKHTYIYTHINTHTHTYTTLHTHTHTHTHNLTLTYTQTETNTIDLIAFSPSATKEDFLSYILYKSVSKNNNIYD